MAKDPRDMVGQNPTGGETRSSGAKRAKAERRETGRKAMEVRESGVGNRG